MINVEGDSVRQQAEGETSLNACAHRVLILTQRLGSNYGGVLQAWALQTTLIERGHRADTNIAVSLSPAKRLLRPPYQWLKAHGLLRHRHSGLTARAEATINRHLLNFVRTRMRTAKLFRTGTAANQRTLATYTDLIVGSDQVWRPPFSDLRESLFDFVPAESDINRFSYAASFGIGDTSEFDPELRRVTKPLAARLGGISVREASGVRMVEELWDRTDAVQHVDPTMLIDPSSYSHLINTAPTTAGRPVPGIAVNYVLDVSETKSRVCRLVEEHLQVPMSTLLGPKPSSYSEYRANPSRFQKIPVESWLAGIRDARFLVTDSFHGCVFAILFHVPFIAIPNSGRGVERFLSLLNLFELQDRIVNVGEEDLQRAVERICKAPIDWSFVESRLGEERTRSLDYLDAQLTGRLDTAL